MIDIKKALAEPFDYVLSLSSLGWTLSEIGSEISMLITHAEAEAVIAAFNEAQCKCLVGE